MRKAKESFGDRKPVNWELVTAEVARIREALPGIKDREIAEILGTTKSRLSRILSDDGSRIVWLQPEQYENLQIWRDRLQFGEIETDMVEYDPQKLRGVVDEYLREFDGLSKSQIVGMIGMSAANLSTLINRGTANQSNNGKNLIKKIYLDAIMELGEKLRNGEIQYEAVRQTSLRDVDTEDVIPQDNGKFRDFINYVKTTFNITLDEIAELAGINKTRLKNLYYFPVEHKNLRADEITALFKLWEKLASGKIQPERYRENRRRDPTEGPGIGRVKFDKKILSDFLAAVRERFGICNADIAYILDMTRRRLETLKEHKRFTRMRLTEAEGFYGLVKILEEAEKDVAESEMEDEEW